MTGSPPGGTSWSAAPFTSGVAAWTAPARTRAGADVVLKVSLPHDEARGEAAALRHWAGRGAVRLLDDAPDDWALLLERCRPGSSLAVDTASDDDRLGAGARVLAALGGGGAGPAVAPAGIRRMGAACDRGADVLLRTADRAARRPDAGVPVDRGQVDAAAALLRELPASAARDVVVHGDLNPGNVLRADGRPRDTPTGGRVARDRPEAAGRRPGLRPVAAGRPGRRAVRRGRPGDDAAGPDRAGGARGGPGPRAGRWRGRSRGRCSPPTGTSRRSAGHPRPPSWPVRGCGGGCVG